MSRGRGWPRLTTDERVEEVITTTLEETPAQDTHRSSPSTASATAMSQSRSADLTDVRALKPHTVETWKLSADPQFIDKIRDVVGLYMASPENALVFAAGRFELRRFCRSRRARRRG